MYVEDTCGELPRRLVSDDIVGIVNASVQTMHLVLTILKVHEWPEHVSDYYAIKLHP
jgi:putative flippase GtrA